MQILYTVVVSDTLVGSFLDVLFLSLAVILSELHEKTRRKDWVTEKVHRGFAWGISLFLTVRSPFHAFLLLSSSTPSPFSNNALAEWPLDTYIALSGILCDDIMNKRKYENMKIWKSLIQCYTLFFISNTFVNSPLVLLSFFLNWVSNFT